jgi:hypothetical protein
MTTAADRWATLRTGLVIVGLALVAVTIIIAVTLGTLSIRGWDDDCHNRYGPQAHHDGLSTCVIEHTDRQPRLPR